MSAVAVHEPDNVALSREMTCLDQEMVEIGLLLPRWQAVALQMSARQRGMTAAQMLRRMIGSIVGSQPPAAAAS